MDADQPLKALFRMRRRDLLAISDLLAKGAGPAALVGLLRASRVDHVRDAVRLITRSTRPPERDDMYVLHALSAERYTARELEALIPRGAVMASSMFAKEFRQARAEGRVEAARGLCLAVVKRMHPVAVARVAPLVAGCDSLATLERWTVAAARLPAHQLIRVVSGAGRHRKASLAVSRRRAPRPVRRSASRRAR